MKTSTTCFRIASAILMLGMVWGIAMAASGKHATMPAHAHFNLLGWVSLFLIGVFYRLHPAIDAGRAARIQMIVWVAGTLVQAIGVALVTSAIEIGEPVAVVGSLALLVGAGMFARLVHGRSSA